MLDDHSITEISFGPKYGSVFCFGGGLHQLGVKREINIWLLANTHCMYMYNLFVGILIKCIYEE